MVASQASCLAWVGLIWVSPGPLDARRVGLWRCNVARSNVCTNSSPRCAAAQTTIHTCRQRNPRPQNTNQPTQDRAAPDIRRRCEWSGLSCSARITPEPGGDSNRGGRLSVARDGVEPSTSHFSGERSFQLSYLAGCSSLARRTPDARSDPDRT